MVRLVLTVLGAGVWVAVTRAGGGIDPGGLPPSGGAHGFVAALAVAALAAAGALWWGRRETWSAPALVSVGAVAALAAWSLASMTWAAAPDLAWLAGNRLVLTTAVMVIAVTVAPHVPDAAAAFAVTLSYAASLVLVAAVATRVLPELFAPLADTPRLAAPVGHANTLALVAVFAAPGALVLAGRAGRLPLASVIVALAITVLMMTGSRSGVLALVATVPIAVWAFADRANVLRALACGLLGAVLPVAVALSAPALSREPALPDPADRRGIGLLLGLVVFVGAVVAVTSSPLVAPVTDRLAAVLGRPRGGRIALAGAGVLVVAGAIVSAFADRDASSGLLRLFSSSDNNRADWWEQAWQGFVDAPIIGNGAGGFLLTHLLHRDIAVETLQARQPHQIGLELASELGLIGILLGLLALGGLVWGARRGGRRTAPALCIVTAFLLQAQLDIPHASASVLIAVAAATGLIVAARTGPVTGARSPIRRTALAIAGSAALVACAAGGILMWSAARTAGSAFVDAADAAVQAETAADRNPVAIRALLILARARSAQGERDAAAAAGRRATERQPDNPFGWECLAAVTQGPTRTTALARWGELDPARDPAVPPRCQPAY